MLHPVQQARRGLALYFAILVPMTALLEGIMISRGEFTPWVILWMFTSTSGERATLWVGESGILVMLTVIVVVVLLARTWRADAGSA